MDVVSILSNIFFILSWWILASEFFLSYRMQLPPHFFSLKEFDMVYPSLTWVLLLCHINLSKSVIQTLKDQFSIQVPLHSRSSFLRQGSVLCHVIKEDKKKFTTFSVPPKSFPSPQHKRRSFPAFLELYASWAKAHSLAGYTRDIESPRIPS